MRKTLTRKTFVAMMLFAFAMLAALAGPSSGSSGEQLKEFIKKGWDFYIGAFDCET